MNRKALLVLVLTCIGCIGSLQATTQQPSAHSTPASSYRALLDRYCIACHNVEDWAGNIAFDTLSLDHVHDDAATWEAVDRKLRTASMPPAGKPRPDKAGYDSFATYLEAELDAAAAARPNPGRTSAVHRLNRTEYANAIRDLLALEVDAESLLPADEAGAGFDNDGEVLSVSAMLMERYLIAARQISRTAVADISLRPKAVTFEAPATGLQTARASEYLPFGSRGGMAIRHNFPLDGEYSIKIRLQRTKGIEGPRIIGLGEPHQLDVRLDGARVKLFAIGGEQNVAADEVEAGLEIRFPVKAGSRLVGVTFLNEDLAPEGMQRPSQAGLTLRGWGPRDDSRRPPGVESVAISGPYSAKRVTATPSRQDIFVCRPKETRDEDRCAKKILARLAWRAYRRPVTDADIEGLLKHYKAGRDAQKIGNGFEEGIRMALEAMLVSPDFLYRIELDPPKTAQGVYRIGDFKLASRLSFFLWSSIPDEELLHQAAAGKLRVPSVLQQQVRRMLADSRSKALVENFLGQWLGLRGLKSHLPDAIAFPSFDDDLRAAFQQETDLLLTSMLREDRSVVELLNANYTYVNDRLARHYGIPNVYGSQFRRITLTDENRWGILGKGAILMITSLPNRTSPVLRGKWVLENVLGVPPSPPPPNVPPLPENKDTDLTQLTVRQRLEEHRKNPACAACHTRMDPLGFAFDNFDAVGMWRSAEISQSFASPEVPVAYSPVDSSGSLPDGTRFKDSSELRRILLRNPGNFAYVVTDKLLTYALGRRLDYYDAPAIRSILRGAAPGNYRWSAIISGIVTSTPFQMRVPAGPESLSKPQMNASSGPKIAARGH